MTWTVPTIPVSPSAASTTRSPRATLSDTPRQNISALPRVIGSMKFTDAPPSTQSIRTSLKSARSRLVKVRNMRIVMPSGTSRREQFAEQCRIDIAAGEDRDHGLAFDVELAREQDRK